MNDLVAQLNAVLPQTQCTRCGYPACLPYAQALADGSAQINQCPPGGQAGVARLAALLGQPELPLDPAFGISSPVEWVAQIVESECIGCTKCIQACPVDAIIGAANVMHMVLSEACTGCELCVPPCPVDCIDMVVAPELPNSFARAPESLAAFTARNARLQRLEEQERARRAARKLASANPLHAILARAQKPA